MSVNNDVLGALLTEIISPMVALVAAQGFPEKENNIAQI